MASSSSPMVGSPRRVIGRRSVAAMSPLSPAARAFRPNNDMLEKEASRRSLAREALAQQAQGSPLKLGPARPAPRVTAEKTRDQITDMYASCIKLCTENKINQKNSWQLPLIDYMEDVMDVQHGEMTNFQMASCTLDASVKIYSCRVDSIHSEAYKVLGGFGRQEDAETEAGKGGAVDSDDEEAGAQGKTKRRRAVNTLESNPAALNVKKFDLEFDIDPLFKQTTAAFDEGGARGLLLNHLTTQDQAALIFDSQDSLTTSTTPTKPTAEADGACRELFAEFATAVSAASQAKVCPSLANFTFMGWQPSEEGEEDGDASTTASEVATPAALNLNMDVNMDASAYFAGVDSDDEDGGAMDQGPLDMDFDDDYEAPVAQHRVAVPTGLTVALEEGDTEYTYFTDKHLQHWAGPSHWRFQRKATDEAVAAKAKPGGRKERFLLDFFAEPLDQALAFACSRAATVLTKATLNKGAADNLLPQDTHYDIARLQRLFCRPNSKVAVRHTAAEVDAPLGEAFYDYNNAGDIGNYCAPLDDEQDAMSDGGFDGPGGFDDDMDAPDFGSSGDGMTASDTGDLALVAEPRKVEKISIDYARHAKRVNVKQLKRSMWDELTTSELKKKADAATSDSVAGQRHFSELVARVPSKVPASMAQNLSVPIMFVCLLHLANEKNLKITNDGGNTADLTIASG